MKPILQLIIALLFCALTGQAQLPSALVDGYVQEGLQNNLALKQ